MYGGAMTLNTFLAYVLKTWIFASGVVAPNDGVIETPGAWTEVLVSDKHCLMYRSALKMAHHGELAVFNRRPDGSCLESISNHMQASVLLSEKPVIKVDEKKVEISLKHDEEEAKSSFQFWGVKNLERNAFVGDRNNLQTKFLNANDECEDNCHLCRDGWMHVSAVSGVKKICHNPLECGGRGQPACYLGQDWGGKKRSGCVENSIAGWCQGELSITCSSETNFLVCE